MLAAPPRSDGDVVAAADCDVNSGGKQRADGAEKLRAFAGQLGCSVLACAFKVNHAAISWRTR